MHLILRYPNGRRVEALVLLRGERVMRVAVRGRNETLEFRLVSNRWISEDGQRVSIEAVLSDPYQGGRQTNTKYSATADIPKTRTAAMRSTDSGLID